MNIRTKLLMFCALAFAVLFLPALASAQGTITCESNDGGRKYCGNANPGQVSLARQLSQAACIQGNSWGVDNQGLWVDRGCRAEFRVGGWNGGGNEGSTVTCESNDGNRKYCGRYNPGQVSLQRQISGASCMQGQTWGVDGQGLWVDRGCRAEFTINSWNNGGNGSSVTCESNDGNRKYCGYAANGQVSLQRQLSQAACIQWQTWGVDNQGLWVDRGCRAVFNVGGNGGNWNGGGNGDWNSPGVSNYPRVRVDTSGRGSFSSQNFGNSEISRGWVDTRSGSPAISLSGPGNFKVTFYGVVTRVDGRHLTLRINRSDRGQAFGTAEVYLNGDKNEVQSISLNGNGFNGSFSR